MLQCSPRIKFSEISTDFTWFYNMVSQFISKESFHTVVYDYFLNTKLKLNTTLNDLTSDLQSTIFTTYSKPVENYYQCHGQCITHKNIGRWTSKYYAAVRRLVKIYLEAI